MSIRGRPQPDSPLHTSGRAGRLCPLREMTTNSALWLADLSTHERGELKTFLFLIQLDYWQAVYAESGGDFAAVMDVMFDHMPDDPLARNCGSHFSSQTRRIQPHLGVWLERGLYQFRVTHTFRIIERRDDLLSNVNYPCWGRGLALPVSAPAPHCLIPPRSRPAPVPSHSSTARVDRSPPSPDNSPSPSDRGSPRDAPPGRSPPSSSSDP